MTSPTPQALRRLSRTTLKVHDGTREVPVSEVAAYVRELRTALGEALEVCTEARRLITERVHVEGEYEPAAVKLYSRLFTVERHGRLIEGAHD